MNQEASWQPGPERIAQAQITAFARRAEARFGLSLPDYPSLWRWSVDERASFWRQVWEDCGLIGEPGGVVLEEPGDMLSARWFPEARLNFAENLLRPSANDEALVFWGEDKLKRRMSRVELRRQVAQLAAALSAQGVIAGDRVAAWLPNMPEALIAMLAAASIGAIFTSASPDFGVQGALDRFGQVLPKVLIGVDGYFYGGKTVSTFERLKETAEKIPGLERVVLVSYVGADVTASDLPCGIAWDDFLAPHAALTEPSFVRLPFDHPLYIMYSSGTTGVPKCIVHGAGGTLLQQLKEHRLHCDVREGDRVFYFTTCGWMMWNWLVAALGAGATLLLFDGSPFGNPQTGRGDILFDYADAEGMTLFGTSAKYLDALAKTGLHPRSSHGLSALRALTSTGSPLAAEGFDFVYQAIKPDLQLASISGGTDIISCFVLGNPTLPVWRGEIQCRGLGMAVDVWDEDGQPVRGVKGELVCTRAFPSMPVGFWNDPRGEKYKAAYFERFPGIWCHGDFCEITEHEGLIIHGRSDATLNPGGVRIGTAEIYRQVERLPEIAESLAISQNWPPDSLGDVRVVLFVRLKDGLSLDDPLRDRIKRAIRDNTTPRHVPAKIVQVMDIPRTRSGKLVELAVRKAVHGEPVKNMEALSNPEALAHFRDRPELAVD